MSAVDRLCPKCGAYWVCGCEREELDQQTDPACMHDWVDAVGVDRDESFPDNARVIMCRLCGLYAVTPAEGLPRQASG